MKKDAANAESILADIYSSDDAGRFVDVVTLLRAHLRQPPIITGSFGAECQILATGGEAKQRHLNDIDLVAADGIADILPSLSDEFLIHHFHPTREQGNVLMQVVEPRSRTRVDIFSPRSPSIVERASKVTFGDVDCLTVSAADLAARLLAIVVIVLDGKSVDPKYFASFERLMKVVDMPLVSQLWHEYRWGSYTGELRETAAEVRRVLNLDSGLLKKTEYSQDLESVCEWCVASDEFPLAGNRKIFEILGHV